MSKLKKILPPFLFKKISDNSVNTNHDCPGRYWCKECVPSFIIDGWSSGNSEIDEFIKDTIYNVVEDLYIYSGVYNHYPLFLEWVEFDRFKNVKQIGKGGFAKVYSATWIDGKAKYKKQSNGSWEKLNYNPMTVALKRLNDSQNISDEYLNEVYFLLIFNFLFY
jgi:hypothetical protein